MKIIVDLDGTVVNLVQEIFKRHFARTGKYLREETVKEWNFIKDNPDLNDILQNDTGLFLYLEAYPYAIRCLENLIKAGHEIIIATGIPSANKTAAWEKIEWCRRNLPFVKKDNVVLTDGKWNIQADWMIDDKPTNFVGFPNRKILFSQPYNITWQVDSVEYNLVSDDWIVIEQFLLERGKALKNG